MSEINLSDRIRVQVEDFSVEDETEKLRSVSKRIGGMVTFLGTAREYSKGREIHHLTFEHYPGMAEKCLSAIRERALKEHDIIDVTILHRVGKISIGENIVLVIAAAEHRAAAFTACAFCIDELKKTAPIWKRENTASGEFWVEDHP